MIGQEEINLVSGVFSFLSDKPIIWDIGSNKGDWADIILKQYGDDAKIFLFEPNEKLLSYTEIKFEYRPNIVYNKVALSNRVGLANFYYFENYNNELSSLHKQDWWEKELPMKTGIARLDTVDNVCKMNSVEYIDYLKIDAEGNDYFILMGAIEMMQKDKIRFVQIEYGGHYQIPNVKFADIIKQVNELGYKVYSYNTKTNNYDEIKLETFIEDYHYENFLITKEEIHTYSIDGWNREFVESVKDLPKINFYLECGVFEGFATKWVCENLLEEGGRCIAIDLLRDFYVEPHDHPYFRGQYQRFLRTTKDLPVELRRKDSREELPRMHQFRFDLCYIDGNHSEFYVYHDGCDVFKITKIGGHILFDDAFGYSEETTKGIEKFMQAHDGRFEIIKKGYQLLIKKTQD